MKTSDALTDFAAAYSKAQGAIEPALKDRTNPAFRSKYADLTSVWDACRHAITSNGLSVIQEVTATPEGIAITTRILHTSGQWMELGPTPIPIGKRDAQGVGSAITYGKRYALTAAFGVVADDDDDGNHASGRGQRQQQQAEAPAPEHKPEPAKRTPPAKSDHPMKLVVGALKTKWAKLNNEDPEAKSTIAGFTSYSQRFLERDLDFANLDNWTSAFVDRVGVALEEDSAVLR